MTKPLLTNHPPPPLPPPTCGRSARIGGGGEIIHQMQTNQGRKRGDVGQTKTVTSICQMVALSIEFQVDVLKCLCGGPPPTGRNECPTSGPRLFIVFIIQPRLKDPSRRPTLRCILDRWPSGPFFLGGAHSTTAPQPTGLHRIHTHTHTFTLSSFAHGHNSQLHHQPTQHQLHPTPPPSNRDHPLVPHTLDLRGLGDGVLLRLVLDLLRVMRVLQSRQRLCGKPDGEAAQSEGGATFLSLRKWEGRMGAVGRSDKNPQSINKTNTQQQKINT